MVYSSRGDEDLFLGGRKIYTGAWLVARVVPRGEYVVYPLLLFDRLFTGALSYFFMFLLSTRVIPLPEVIFRVRWLNHTFPVRVVFGRLPNSVKGTTLVVRVTMV